jgi:hypothetical protein
MSGSTIFVIIAAIGIMVLIAWISMKSKKQLTEQGKIIERRSGFYEEKSIFRAAAPFDAFAELLLKKDYTEIAATPERESENSVLIRSAQGWNAVAESLGESDGKYIIEFYFTAWKTKNGGPLNSTSMNYILTDVEKTVLSLDPSATVERQKMQFKSKTDLF